MTVTLQDILDQVNDFNANYSVSTIDLGNKYRAINRATEYVKRRMGLPSDKKIHTFRYYEDEMYYDMPTGFDEGLQLYYNFTDASITRNINKPETEWWGAKDDELLARSAAQPTKNQYAPTTINGSNQLMLVGRNINPSLLIQGFDSTSGLTFSSSITGTVIDTVYKRQGYGSLKFNVSNAESTSTITYTYGMNIESYLNNSAALRCYLFFPTGATSQISSVSIKLQSSTGNYYSISTTTKSDGTSWDENAWNKLSFPFSSATTTGTPVATSITSIIISIVHSGSFSSISNMRIDNLYLINPDLMDLIYYSAYKGTDTTGATPKIIMTAGSDIFYFGSIAPDLILPIALKAALILWPQLRNDETFWRMYKTDFEDTIKIFGRVYPRYRQTGVFGQTILKR